MSNAKRTQKPPNEEEVAHEAMGESNENALDEAVPEGKLVCALTGEFKSASAQEELLQSLVEQLHREYGVPLEEMARDVRIACYAEDSGTGKLKSKNRVVSLVVYEADRPRDTANIIRVALVAKPGTKPEEKAIATLNEVLGSLNQDRAQLFGIWTNGTDLAFRMRTYNTRTGDPIYTALTDMPAPHESLEDLESGTRRPLRIATGDSLLQTFKRCHDYLYGNQSMRGDRAFLAAPVSHLLQDSRRAGIEAALFRGRDGSKFGSRKKRDLDENSSAFRASPERYLQRCIRRLRAYRVE